MTTVLPAVWTALVEVCFDGDLRDGRCCDVIPKLHTLSQKFKVEVSLNVDQHFVKNSSKSVSNFEFTDFVPITILAQRWVLQLPSGSAV